MIINLKRTLTSSVHLQYWGEPSSTVDWCEINYEHTQYIAEFFNTLSSFCMAIVGLMGILFHPWAERRFKVAFLATSIVGLGSVCFHGTLSKFSQALDEVPMLYSALSFLYIALCQRFPSMKPATRHFLAVVLVVHATATTYLVTAFDGGWQFIFFHISFGTAQIYAVYQIVQLYRAHRKTSSKSDINLVLELGIFYYLCSFGCWLIDMLGCEYVNPAYEHAILPINPQFHAIWHLLISMGLYKYLLFI
jgi:dihydroceramidase